MLHYFCRLSPCRRLFQQSLLKSQNKMNSSPPPSSSSSFGLDTAATFDLGKGIKLRVGLGSVVNFDCPEDGAIVNAANEEGLGGGGVDGAISDAGGEKLFKDRVALPIVGESIRASKRPGGDVRSLSIRIPTGQARLTGPGDYGSLNVPYVVHAVGPMYNMFPNFSEPDNLLRSAYQATLECCCGRIPGTPDAKTGNPPIRHVAFSLLSAGVFRGQRSLGDVLTIGLHGIRDWVATTEDCGDLKTVVLCAFNQREANVLITACQKTFLDP